jgi:hypothetical protein
MDRKPVMGRRFAVLRLGWAAALLWLHQRSEAPSRGVRAVICGLAMRHAAQGAATLVRPSPDVLKFGAAVDATHAVSMAVVAATRAGTRRLAGIDATIAGAAAITGPLLVASGDAG